MNRATREELLAVPGIGPVMAEAIVALRREKGAFARLEDLLAVQGIGGKRLAELETHLFVAQVEAGKSDSPKK